MGKEFCMRSEQNLSYECCNRHTYFVISMKKYDLRITKVLFLDLSVPKCEKDIDFDRLYG